MKPYHEGVRAFYKPKFKKTEKGYLLEENPYPKDTKEHRDWEFGFSKAFYENLRARSYGV